MENGNHDILLLSGTVCVGTGKTTTLLEYARLRPHLKFLLVVYNK